MSVETIAMSGRLQAVARAGSRALRAAGSGCRDLHAAGDCRDLCAVDGNRRVAVLGPAEMHRRVGSLLH